MGSVSNMNSRQLRSYLGKLNGFTSRRTAFVPGVNGNPIDKILFARYKNMENQFNSIASAFEGAIAGVKVPGTGRTIAERQASLGQGPRAGGDFRTFQQISRDSTNLLGDEAVKKLIKGMEKKLSPGYLAKEMAQLRENLETMLTTTGDTETLTAVRDMSDEKLNILTGYTDFMDKAGFRYDFAKSVSTDTPRWQSQMYDNEKDRVESLVDWAANLPDDIIKSASKPPKRKRSK